MTEHLPDKRCPECEALITEQDCLECVWYAQHMNSVRVMGQRLSELAPATRTHCVNGHEMTKENTRIDVRIGLKQGITRTCRACLRQRVLDHRARKGSETTQPRELGKLDRGRVAPTGRMTEQTLPVEGTT